MTQHTLTKEHTSKAPLTLDDVRALLADAERAGLPGTAELTARARIRDSRLTRLQVTGDGGE